MRILVLVIFSFFAVFANSQTKTPAAADSKITRIESDIKAIQEKLDRYGELETRLKETSNALAQLNRQFAETGSELEKVSGELQSLKTESDSKPRESAPAGLTPEQLEKMNGLETEISSLKNELKKIQDSIKAGKEAPDREESAVPEPNEIKNAVSSPWVGLTALIISVVALFTPIK